MLDCLRHGALKRAQGVILLWRVSYARPMTWELGRRIRETRLRLGMTQQEVADGIVSAAFLSMVESGRREPSPEVLVKLTERLGLSSSSLHDVGGTAGLTAIRTALARAEVSVEVGDFEAALRELDAIDRLFAGQDEPDLRAEFHYWRGRAMEGLTRTDSAIRELLTAVEISARRGSTYREIEMGIDLARCLRIRGDLGAALDRVNRLEQQLPAELEGSPLHGKLLSAAIGLYVLRGDSAMARVMADRAQRVIAAHSDPLARGHVMWNSSLAAEANADADGALLLATEAARLMRAGTAPALLGRLHAAIAFLHTRVTPPDLDSAERELRAARVAFGAQMVALDASTLLAEEARVQWLRGDFATALASARAALDALQGRPNSLLAANAHLMSARALASLGERERSREQFHAAQRILGATEPSRNSAVGWRELGDVYLNLGMADDAVLAYQLALSDAGLTAAPVEVGTIAAHHNANSSAAGA